MKPRQNTIDLQKPERIQTGDQETPANGTLTRRVFFLGAPLALGACQTKSGPTGRRTFSGLSGTFYPSAYAATRDGGFRVPAIAYQKYNPKYLRQKVSYLTRQPAGTIIIDPHGKFLYLVEGNGMAMRYGIGVGRAGFAWSGEAYVKFKREWPKWFPPAEMIAREKRLEKFRNGMDGGPGNPIGARGLYLWQGNKDTLYRIHGTMEPNSIGSNVSSGCIRLWPQDVIDLYNRVNIGAKVIVKA